MIEEDQGKLPSAPLVIEHDNNGDRSQRNLRIAIALNIKYTTLSHNPYIQPTISHTQLFNYSSIHVFKYSRTKYHYHY